MKILATFYQSDFVYFLYSFFNLDFLQILINFKLAHNFWITGQNVQKTDIFRSIKDVDKKQRG